jgi:hypothetical protein
MTSSILTEVDSPILSKDGLANTLVGYQDNAQDFWISCGINAIAFRYLQTADGTENFRPTAHDNPTSNNILKLGWIQDG